ncbi:oligosaccharide flippase family protein [Starkeya koreensis]|uniref:Oligosaccharide flippase family protein n=1 Tax=Ancylobacter koreensis TaxID=266121 RepID=A0ABT0DQK8_9HYPH|nr:oligosaccharide flippase family protein [Ancylobacter koreensis]MCK0209387.1 oligosaccharide flippase family protein [Ancylobacter koreensis]
MSKARLPELRRLIAVYGPYAGGLVARGVELVAKLGLYMLAARILGAHEAGLYFLCMTWMGLAATLARAGFEKASVRHIAGDLAIGRLAEARSAMLTGFGWTALGSVAATLATLALAVPASRHVFDDPDLVRPLTIGAASIVPQAMCVYVANVLFGYGRSVAGQWVQNAAWPSFALAAMLAGVQSLDGMLYTLAAANLASALIGLALIPRGRSVQRRSADPETVAAAQALPALWRTALPLGIVEVVQVSLNSVPLLLLAVFASPTDVGAFSVASRLSMLIWVVIISIGAICAPRFASLHRLGDWEGLRAQNRRARLLVALCGLPPLAVMMFFPAPLLALIGPGFEIAAAALVIMSLGQLVNCLLPCQDIMLAMTGHGGMLRWLNAAQLAVCALAGAVLVPLFGMNGAAVLSALVILQGAVGTALAVRHVLPRAF